MLEALCCRVVLNSTWCVSLHGQIPYGKPPSQLSRFCWRALPAVVCSAGVQPTSHVTVCHKTRAWVPNAQCSPTYMLSCIDSHQTTRPPGPPDRPERSVS